MADGYGLALQKGLVAALRADAGVTALVSTRVYDDPPQDVTFPYVRIGDIQEQPYDTQTQTGAEPIVDIRVYSRPNAGKVEASRVSAAIYDALHRQEASVTVAGFTLIELRRDALSTRRQSDGRTWESVSVFRALLASI